MFGWLFRKKELTEDTWCVVRIISQRVERLHEKLNCNLKWSAKMSETMQKLKDEIAGMTTVVGSAVALIDGLIAKLEAANGDQAAINAALAEVKADREALAAAVAANAS